MKIGFFTVFRTDPQHLLHGDSLVREAAKVMPGVPVVQFTDRTTPQLDGAEVRRFEHGPMLERRLEHYAACEGEWLLLDTDISIRADVQGVFEHPAFDIALTDRNWPHLPQGDSVLQEMPFNTGVCFSRSSDFWKEVLRVWKLAENKDWMSEQRAVATVARSGYFRVQVLDGMRFNYPPKSEHDPAAGAALVHYKGPRKTWLSNHIRVALAKEASCV